MSLHLQRDLDSIKKEILKLGNMVESTIRDAISALDERRPELAERVVNQEKLIDQKEISIEEDCLKILALHQPVAVDLRFVVMVLKVNNDLERMGDLAVNLVERAVFLASVPPIPSPVGFSKTMPDSILVMVRDSLDALVKLDTGLARKVIAMDVTVDDIHRNIYGEMRLVMENDKNTIERAVGLISASRYLERIADLATNIAEDVVFMVEGVIVRHHVLDV